MQSDDAPSVRRGETLAAVLRPLDLVDDGNGEVLAADQALALPVFDQAIAAQTEFAGAGAGLDRRWRRDGRPIEVSGLADLVECQRRRLGGRRHGPGLLHVFEM